MPTVLPLPDHDRDVDTEDCEDNEAGLDAEDLDVESVGDPAPPGGLARAIAAAMLGRGSAVPPQQLSGEQVAKLVGEQASTQAAGKSQAAFGLVRPWRGDRAAYVEAVIPSGSAAAALVGAAAVHQALAATAEAAAMPAALA